MKWLLCAITCLMGFYAQAAPPTEPRPPAGSVAYNCAISAAQAGKIARNTFGGKVIDIKTAQHKGRAVYRVKLLQQNGRIHTVLIDANSGRPLK